MRERIQDWVESLEIYVLDVMTLRRTDAKATTVRGILYCLSVLFEGIVKIRKFLYEVRILRDTTLGVQIIAIGNLTVGGTGKTPVVEKFARELTDQNRKVAILSRGYRSKPKPLLQRILDTLLFRRESSPPKVVSDGKSLMLDSEQAGDEPFMLASNLKNVVVLVDKDRVKSGRYAVENFGCDTLLLDDGFQYWKLYGRRQDVVLIDAQQPFGIEGLLPRGTLREPHEHLNRASVIFITKSNGQTKALRERIAKYNNHASIIECVHDPKYFVNVYNDNVRIDDLSFISGKKIACLSGIAQPESFEESLISLGAELVYTKSFADHHRYTQQEILNVINRSKHRGAELIITTQKDAVRFPKLDRRDIDIYYLRVEVKIIAGATSFNECVKKICFSD